MPVRQTQAAPRPIRGPGMPGQPHDAHVRFDPVDPVRRAGADS